MTEQNLSAQLPDAAGNKQHGAKTVFWYLSLFWTMATVAFATGAVWFQVINKFFPVEIGYSVGPAFNQYAVKGAIAALIVGAPAFFLFAWLIRKAINRDEIQLKKGARQWISYLILFIVVATALGDIIQTILAWLNGNFTTPFLLKSLVILLITGWIFTYFWQSLRSDDGLRHSSFAKIVVVISAVLIAATLIIGFTMVETPSTAQAKAYDNRRLEDLNQIQGTVDSYYSTFNKLPTSLDALTTISRVPADPKTNQPYTYQIITKTSYKLCAVFETTNKNTETNQITKPDYGVGFFEHTTGENCYALLVTTDYKSPRPLAVPITD